MNTSTYFRDWIYTVYKPCALVYSSEKVKQLFNKNNLTPADFLRPLGDFQGRHITYPYNDKENLSIPNLRFDFFDSEKFNKINYDDISRAVGVDAKTIKKWWSILETSGIITILEPFAKNKLDRIIKTPKLYFMDTGLCAYLCKWNSPKQLEESQMAGNFYETFVVSEIIKSYYNAGFNPKSISNNHLYYYRDKDGAEIDLVIEAVEGIYPIEIKKGINPVSSNKNFNVLKKYGIMY